MQLRHALASLIDALDAAASTLAARAGDMLDPATPATPVVPAFAPGAAGLQDPPQCPVCFDDVGEECHVHAGLTIWPASWPQEGVLVQVGEFEEGA